METVAVRGIESRVGQTIIYDDPNDPIYRVVYLIFHTDKDMFMSTHIRHYAVLLDCNHQSRLDFDGGREVSLVENPDYPFESNILYTIFKCSNG